MPLPDPPAFGSPDSGADPFSLREVPPALPKRVDLPPLPPPKRARGRVLQVVANGLWMGVLLEGLLGFAGCFPAVSRGVPGLGMAQGWMSFGVTVLFVWELLLICSYRRLPWGELAGVLAVVFWSRFLYLPLPGLFEWENLEFMGSLLMVGTALGSAGVIRHRLGTPWMPGLCFEGATFSWGRSLGTLALKLGVGVPVLLLYVVYSVRWMVDWRTHGFMRLEGRGIVLEARSYGRDRLEGRVHLLPTAHIGTDRFYERLMSGVPLERSVLLPEGVTDKRGVLTARWSYAGPARAAGFREQPDFTQQWKATSVNRCDVDLSELSVSTQELLSRFSGCLQRWNDGDWVGGLELLREIKVDTAAVRLLRRDILELRNERVTRGVEEVCLKYGNVLVPWGALHMAGIEEGLLAKGFRVEGRREVVMLEWREVMPWLLMFPERP